MESERKLEPGTHKTGCSPDNTPLQANNTCPPSVFNTDETGFEESVADQIRKWVEEDYISYLEHREYVRGILASGNYRIECQEMLDLYRDAMAEALGG